jgi:WD40 repeat protein
MNTAATVEIATPFPGLRPFREGEDHLFFGRESQVDTMIDKLAGRRFLAVVGTSGSGKSSLVNCGLRPALHRGLMAKAGTSWRMAQFRPGSNPLRAMARALAKDGTLFSGFESAGMTLEDMIEASLRMSNLGLADIYEQAHLGEGANLLVVVDQFEELFRYRALGASAVGDGQKRSQEATAFVNLLLEAKAQANFPIYIVLTMRSDYLGDCAEFPGLPEAINEGQYLVPRMTREERRAAIAGPVGVGGAEITPVLLTRLVNDVGDNPDQLSILQHALNRTWARWEHEGKCKGRLDLRHYEAIGTMARALDQHAEKAFGELETERQKKICEKIFKALTDKGTDPRGIRRPTKLETLCALADASPAEVTEVIDVFRKPSRSFLMPPLPEALEPDTVIDISHESLMRVWERLKDWADDEAHSAQEYRRLSETAAQHRAGRESLLHDPRLQLALNWRDQEAPTEAWAGLYGGGFEPAMSFLAESKAQRDQEVHEQEESQKREFERQQELALERQKRELERKQDLAIAEELRRAAQRYRKLYVNAVVAAVCAIVFFIIAAGLGMWYWQESRKDEERKNDADSRRLAQVAFDSLSVDPEASLRLALQAASATADKPLTSDAEDALHRALQAPRSQLTLRIPGGMPRGVAFSPDGRLLATTSAGSSPTSTEGEVILWETGSGKRVASLPHPGGVAAFGFSPDGRYLATASFDLPGTRAGNAGDDTVRLWDVNTHRAEVTLKHQGGVRALAFSADGRYLATASQDKHARLWAVPGGSLVKEMGHGAGVTAVAFTPDGSHLATGSEDKTARLWDITTGLETANMPHQGPVMAIALSLDGKLLATISQATPGHGAPGAEICTVALWDAAVAKRLHILDTSGEMIYAIAFSPDSTLLATGARDAKIWNVSLGRPMSTLSEHTGSILALAFSPDGKRLATAGSDKRVNLWDVATAQQLFTLSGHTDSIVSIAFSADGKRLATASSDHTARIWSILPGDALWSRAGHQDAICRVVFSVVGKKLATASWDKTAKVWDAAKGKELYTLSGHTAPVLGVAFSPDGKRIATSSEDWTAKVWDATSGKELLTLTGHAAPVTAVAFSPDGKYLATASRDYTAKVWDTKTGKVLLTLTGHGDHVEDVAFSPDGKWLATASTDKTAKVKVWDAATGKERLTLSHNYWVQGVAFSPDSKRLATASWDGTVIEWEIPSGKELFRLVGDTAPIHSVAFNPDGTRLATASEDHTARIWDASSGKMLFTLAQSADKIFGVAFSPDGSSVATSGADGEVTVYELLSKKLIEQVRSTHPRLLTAAECTKYEVESGECEVAKRIKEACNWASSGNVGDNDRSFGSVETFHPRLPLDTELRIEVDRELNTQAARCLISGYALLLQDDPPRDEEAAKAYSEAVSRVRKLDPDRGLPAEAWNDLCRYGSLGGHAGEDAVKSACEKAVALDPENPGIHDSRGLARALTGNVKGAIDDFRFFILQTNYPTLKAQRQGWVDALGSGKKPLEVFTPDVIKQLLRQ